MDTERDCLNVKALLFSLSCLLKWPFLGIGKNDNPRE